MKKPATIEYLYLDFDSFFASVEEQARPRLRGKPIAVIPFAHSTATCVIAANRLAKDKGIKTGMSVLDARRLCSNLELVPQSPDLYERAHQKLILLIEQSIPIGGVASIDELYCKLELKDKLDPFSLSEAIKSTIRNKVGPYITCSIGMAPNIQLAKIASDMDKPDGLTIIRPEDLPGRLLELSIDDIPGIGRRMRQRLIDAGIWTVEALWNTQPKELRALWGNVTGERMWYALHGYEVLSQPTERSMYGHGRTLPPEWRNFDCAFEAAKLLTIKAARRLRRDTYNARKFAVWIVGRHDRWAAEYYIGEASDDHAGIWALNQLWREAKKSLPVTIEIIMVHVAFLDLRKATSRQADLFEERDDIQEKWAKLSSAADMINRKYAKTVLSLGDWKPPLDGYAGGKIAFSRIPDMEDFW